MRKWVFIEINSIQAKPIYGAPTVRWCWGAQSWPSGGPEDAVCSGAVSRCSDCVLLSVGASRKATTRQAGCTPAEGWCAPPALLHHTHTSPRPRSRSITPAHGERLSCPPGMTSF